MRSARLHSILCLSLAVAAALVDAPAQAQAYRCTGPEGPYYADRPCPSASPTAPVVPSRPLPPLARPTDHLSYMSAECASLSDGLRTAPPRARFSGSQADLRADYNRRCAAEEAEARRRFQSDLGRRRQGQADQLAIARADARRNEAEQQRTMEQCREMHRIIAGKNERLAQLTPGELADLQRFEANFAARCKQRAP